MMMRSYIISGIMDFFFYRNIYESPNIVPLHICMQYKYVGICLQCIFCLFTFRLSNRRAAIDPLHIPVTHTGTVLAHFTQWAKNVKYSEKIEVCSRDYSITSEAENIARCSTPTSWNTKIVTYETWKSTSFWSFFSVIYVLGPSIMNFSPKKIPVYTKKNT